MIIIPHPKGLSVAAQIKHLRLAAGISGRQLAREAGVTQANLSRLLAEKYDPSISTIEQIAAALAARLKSPPQKKGQARR